MTPDLFHKLTVVATPPTINGRTSDAIRPIRVLFNKAGVDPLDAVLRLAKERAGRVRQSRPLTGGFIEAVENGESDPRDDGWNIEAIMATIAGMDDTPTPADLSRLARHFHTTADRAKWPATTSELVEAVRRLRKNERIGDEKLSVIAAFDEAFSS